MVTDFLFRASLSQASVASPRCGRLAEPAHGVASDGILHLQHLLAELAHDRGRVGSRQEGADVDDANAPQRQRLLGGISRPFFLGRVGRRGVALVSGVRG